MRSRLGVILLGGATFGAMFGAGAVPIMFHTPSRFVLAVTSAIVGLQAAQSAVLQTVGRAREDSLRLRVALGLLASIAFVVTLRVPSSLAVAALATCAGATVGYAIGRIAASTLLTAGGVEFQVLMAVRAVILLLVTTLASAIAEARLLLGVISFAIALGALCLLAPRPTRLTSGNLERGHKRAVLLFAVGLGASLYYRNDINWLRASLLGLPDFEAWHIGLLLYSGIQAVIGFGVIHVLFSSRSAWSSKVLTISTKNMLIVWLLWSAAAIVVLLSVPSGSLWLALGLCAGLAAVVGVLSGVAHTCELSWAPYVAGIAGATLVLVMLKVQVEPGQVLAAENALIGTFILIVLTTNVLRKRWQQRCS